MLTARGRARALLVESIHPDAASLLGDEGYNVAALPGALPEEMLVERLAGIELLGIRSGTQVTEAVLAQSPDLLAVGAFCIGTNQIDLK
ncbi:MAG: phosphoglycerate dehydrogenase, partial [Acidimicrobiales bacterium]